MFPPPRNSSLPASLNHPSPADPLPLPPPQPKSCDLIIRPSLHQPEPIPPDPSPQSSRSGIARVSFREPISCSYSVEEDEERREGDEEQAEEEDGGFGSRLHMQKGIPPQMDLLGKRQRQLFFSFSFSFHHKCQPSFIFCVSSQMVHTNIVVYGGGGTVAVWLPTPLST